jgi:ABC-type phosphate transport system substrate-binding protein
MKKLTLHIVCLGLLLACTAVEAMAEVVLVVGKDSPIDSLSRREVNDIFLGTTTRLPKVGKVIPLDRSEDRLRADFYQDYTGKDLPQVKAHWAKYIFTGRGYPPKTVSSIDELKEMLKRNPNAIGYVTPDKVDNSMKALAVQQ